MSVHGQLFKERMWFVRNLIEVQICKRRWAKAVVLLPFLCFEYCFTLER